MKTIQLFEPKLDSLRVVEAADPAPGQGEVLVALRAAGLNYLDLAVATGAYPGPSFPLVPVADGAGEVVALGPGVETLAVGDRVVIHPKAAWTSGRASARRAHIMRGVTLPGSLRELAAVAAESVVRVPAQLSWAQAATLPVSATTAWNALISADVGPSSSVVVLGTGGTSLIALQLAKACGARVIVTSSSDEKLARARELGADVLVNYREKPAWDAEVIAATEGRGADLVLETAGAATFARSLSAARHGGTVFAVGFVSGTLSEVDLMPIIVKSLRVQGNNTGSAEDLADALAVIAARGIAPVVEHIYPVRDVREAYAQLGGGPKHFGKIAIAVEL